MEYHTEIGDICYEPFLGSGTQLIAAEKLSRRCFAMEKEPLYVDVARFRWEAFSGQKATNEEVKQYNRRIQDTIARWCAQD